MWFKKAILFILFMLIASSVVVVFISASSVSVNQDIFLRDILLGAGGLSFCYWFVDSFGLLTKLKIKMSKSSPSKVISLDEYREKRRSGKF